jgi:hypothetical protein
MRFFVGAVLGLLFAGAAFADTQGRVQGDPSVVCEGFKPHELCFALPTDGIARAEYRSVPFYAVVLKSAARCSIPEPERLRVQAMFPRNKVFSLKFGCGDDVEEDITYTNVNLAYGFLAVYAGSTSASANELLRHVKATGQFRGANVRRMQARLIYP